MFSVFASSTVAYADATDDYVRGRMAEKHIPGLALAVLRDGKVVKEAAYGKASLELNVPITLDTSFPLASMTKTFTAAAIMQLVEEGKISLDETVMRIPLPMVSRDHSPLLVTYLGTARCPDR
jgi:CubicO group peptidase (beta-lactamase class C family)